MSLPLTGDGTVLIGNVRDNGAGDYPDSFQDDGFDVGQGSSVLQSYEVACEAESIDLILRQSLNLGSRREEA